MNAQLRSTDTVFATVTAGGSVLANITLSGFVSFAELLKSVCGSLRGVAGLVTVELRNSSLGWLEKRQVRLRAASSAPVQLTLF